MRLFMTSSPCDDDVPEGCELPCIFYTCNQFVDQLSKGYAPGQRAVIVAATPWAHGLNDEMCRTFHRALAWHGMVYADTTVVDDRNVDDLPRLLKQSSLVILGGGHVPTQNAFFRQLGLRALLADYRGDVMGISAGSMNCSEVVYAQPEETGEAVDPAYERWITGLGLTRVMVLPHYQRVKDWWLDGMRLYDDITYGDSMGHTFYALPDSSYVLAEEGQATIYGEAYRISDGVCTLICRHGETLHIPG